MDKTVLVSLDVEKGSRILQILDDAGLQIKVALWAFLSEYEDWRLILSSRKFDEAGLMEAYGRFHKALDSAGVDVEETPVTIILESKDRFIRELRRKYGKMKRVEGMRLSGQAIGDRFVEDSYVYRIT
jgi:hypothetical protein